MQCFHFILYSIFFKLTRLIKTDNGKRNFSDGILYSTNLPAQTNKNERGQKKQAKMAKDSNKNKLVVETLTKTFFDVFLQAGVSQHWCHQILVFCVKYNNIMIVYILNE